MCARSHFQVTPWPEEQCPWQGTGPEERSMALRGPHPVQWPCQPAPHHAARSQHLCLAQSEPYTRYLCAAIESSGDQDGHDHSGPPHVAPSAAFITPLLQPPGRGLLGSSEAPFPQSHTHCPSQHIAPSIMSKNTFATALQRRARRAGDNMHRLSSLKSTTDGGVRTAVEEFQRPCTPMFDVTMCARHAGAELCVWRGGRGLSEIAVRTAEVRSIGRSPRARSPSGPARASARTSEQQLSPCFLARHGEAVRGGPSGLLHRQNRGSGDRD